MYSLLGRLRGARYKGIDILVENSVITFGQKTVTHQYPNTNRTEVEYLGLADDQFELDIYVYGAGLIEKRAKLKKALANGKDGKLIHPFEGEVEVAVVAQPTITDDIGKSGITKFTVTFQKVTPQSYPSKSSGWSLANIAQAVNDIVDAVNDTIDGITNTFSPSVLSNAIGLNDLMDSFDNAMNVTYKLTDKATELNEGILDFKRKLNTYAQFPSDMKASFKSLWNTINFIATSNSEQIKVLKIFYTFGDDYRVISTSTLERTERKKNQDTLVNAVLANSLALSFGTAAVIDYTNQEQLDEIRTTLEDQFEKVKELLNNDILQLIEDLRNQTLGYLDDLSLAEVIEIDTVPTSVLLLSYQLYGTVDRYSDVYNLNKPYNPAFISGTVKVFNE